MLKVKPKKCRQCGKMFTPTYSTAQVTCDYTCAIAYGIAKKVEKEAKEWSKEKKERKEALMTYSEWLNLLQVTFNTYIRQRDFNDPCISCQTTKNVQYAAGHFFTVGGFPNVRFDEDNCHKQCNRFCNHENSGNIHEYRPRLIEKIGIERFEALEYRARNTTLKLSVPEIKEKIEHYKQKIKRLKNENTNT